MQIPATSVHLRRVRSARTSRPVSLIAARREMYVRDVMPVIGSHLVASHHGELAYGSPKVPSTLEAMLLHHLDNLDSKMETVRQAIARDAMVEGCWSAYIPSLERSLLKQDRFLAEPIPLSAPTSVREPVKPSTDFAAKLSGALVSKG